MKERFSKPGGKRFGGFRDRDRREQRRDPSATQMLYGMHSVREALANPNRRFIRLLATENAISRLSEDMTLPIEPELVRPDVIGRMLTPDAVHQGVLLEAEALDAPNLDSLPKDALLLALDQITDPHNVGAVLRSACAFGVTAIVTTMRYSPEITGVLAKAASGALEHVPFIPVRNLVKTLEELGEKGVLRIGLDSEAEKSIDAVELRRPMILVLGAEGKGLRQSTRDICDILARIDLPGAIKSLNVSNAAAVALHAIRNAPRGK